MRTWMGQPDGGDDEEFARLREAARRHSPPSNETPGIAAVEAVLVATDDLAVFVCGMEVYSTGVSFRVEARARRSPARGRRRGIDLMEGMFHDGPGQGTLLLGVEFSDGRRASTTGHHWRGEMAAAEQPMLAPGGGGSSDREADLEMFLSPLPPPGDLLLVCAWPDLIDETITRLPVQPILDAAKRVRVLWPPEPDDDGEPHEGPPPPPPVPPDSWFRAT